VPKAIEIDYNENLPLDESSPERKFKMKFDEVNKFINTHLKAGDNHESILLYVYDLSQYSSILKINNYISVINALFGKYITNSFLVGCKSDKVSKFNDEESEYYQGLVDSYKGRHFRLSTLSFFNFADLFTKLIAKCLDKIIAPESITNIQAELVKQLEVKPYFAKSERKTIAMGNVYPGPALNEDYNVNVYDSIDLRTLKKKERFNKKIFSVKTGPWFGERKQEEAIKKKISNKEKKVDYKLIDQNSIS
jgi:hypothetical protein